MPKMKIVLRRQEMGKLKKPKGKDWKICMNCYGHGKTGDLLPIICIPCGGIGYIKKENQKSP